MNDKSINLIREKPISEVKQRSLLRVWAKTAWTFLMERHGIFLGCSSCRRNVLYQQYRQLNCELMLIYVCTA